MVTLPLATLCFLGLFSTFGLDAYGHTYRETPYSANSMKVEEAIPHFTWKPDPEEIEKLPLF